MPFDTVIPSSPPSSTLHEPFLRRAAEVESSNASGTALGAFLTLRLVDAFSRGPDLSVTEGLAYQARATQDYLDDLYHPSPEAQHLREIVRVAHAAIAERSKVMLLPPLLAFAYWLEQELRLDEALDALETGLRLVEGHEHAEVAAAYLQTGRVLRLKGRFDEAKQCYGTAGAVAERVGDRHSVLLSRIGRGVVLQKLGNLPESERILRTVVEEAKGLADRDAEARASHDLASAMHFMGRTVEAVNLAFHAFSLYEHATQQARAMSDTGLYLKALGHYQAARDAFNLVFTANPAVELRYRALIELLELSALVNDRLSFERCRRDIESNTAELPVDEQVEFGIKLGIGLAAFGQHAEAEQQILMAVAVAENHRLGELLFRAEAALEEVRERRAAVSSLAAHPNETRPAAELAPTIEGLQLLRASA